MGSYAGITARDRGVVSQELACQLRDSLTRGEGATECLLLPSAAVCHRQLFARERAPAPTSSAASRWVARVDGRIFQKHSLATRLLGKAGRDSSDAEIVAAAYERWGVGGFDHLPGEWSACVYDTESGSLVLACDYSGAMPLYYSVDPRHVVWSSELRTFAMVGDTGGVSDDYISGFILHTPSLGTTPFRRVVAVRPGDVVEIRGGKGRTVTSMRPDLRARILYRHDRDYEEHFRELFGRVVADRLHEGEVVWAELSGGLDSSSIVCVADQAAAELPGRSLKTVSYGFIGGNSQDDCDYRGDVLRRVTCPHVEMDTRDLRLLTPPTVAPPVMPVYGDGVVPRLAKLMRADGARVLLSGEGGDAVMWANGQTAPIMTLHERLAARQWTLFMRELQAFGEWTRRGMWDILLHDVVSIRHWERVHDACPPWFTPPKTGETVVSAASTADEDWLGDAPLSVRVANRSVNIIREIVAGQSERLTDAIDTSYPYLDRRLVQFMLAIPFEQKLRPGETRSLQRRALAGLLPESVRTRTTKSIGFGPLINTLRTEWDAVDRLLTSDARLAQRGLVDIIHLRKEVDRARDGLHVRWSSCMWSAIVAEHWLREQEV